MKEYLKLTQRGASEEFKYYVSFCKDSKRRVWHRENDKPTIIWNNGMKLYWKNGKFVK